MSKRAASEYDDFEDTQKRGDSEAESEKGSGPALATITSMSSSTSVSDLKGELDTIFCQVEERPEFNALLLPS